MANDSEIDKRLKSIVYKLSMVFVEKAFYFRVQEFAI